MSDFPLPAPITSKTPVPRFRAASASIRRKNSTNMPNLSGPGPSYSNFSTLSGWDDETHIPRRPRSSWASMRESSQSPWWYQESAEDTDSNNGDDQLFDPGDVHYGDSNMQNDNQHSNLFDLLNDSDDKGKASVESHDDIEVGEKSSKAKGKQKEKAPPFFSSSSSSSSSSISPEILAQHPLSAYTCPICFCPPTNATMTPCGHVACGLCLFTAVKTAARRENRFPSAKDDTGPRCPVCRAIIPGWDGKGGGVIGLTMQTVTITN